MSDKKVISIDSELYTVEHADSVQHTKAELDVPDPKKADLFVEQLKQGRPLNAKRSER
jgi:hypothetical protein